ncbi:MULTISPECIES: formate dehydrogenase accessory sulfurtransferase FdhD [unclassified Archaeoglobus]|uniref:formate dehydrogenase accessory sulfurtransferase FdhD n=1 Tax=unclassified Archaeoglobus TaxID=2643606 RepID=UPI0025C3DD46|nr:MULTISPECIES: formate dehydrogenase accessory sulfurtransferase FdhD [unclassified Archaeoglobus]
MIVKIGEPLELAEEDQFTIFVGRTPYRIMCTPQNLQELTVGFLISEGIAKSVDDIEFHEAPCLQNAVFVNINGNPGESTIRSSGCIGIYREDEVIGKVDAKEKFSVAEAKKALDYLNIREYERTHGYHVAAIVGKKGLLVRRYDVGRHNAVDKAIGAALMKGIDLSRTFLLLSGRISRGIAMKCVRSGVPLVVSKAAILDSAIKVCEKSGLAAISFATNIVVRGEAVDLS